HRWHPAGLRPFDNSCGIAARVPHTYDAASASRAVAGHTPTDAACVRFSRRRAALRACTSIRAALHRFSGTNRFLRGARVCTLDQYTLPLGTLDLNSDEPFQTKGRLDRTTRD